MAQITVSSHSFPNWEYGGSTGTIRVFAVLPTVTSDGVIIMPSRIGLTGWLKEVPCTVSGKNLISSAFVIDSTTDSSDPRTEYVFVIYDENNIRRGIVGDKLLQIPASPTTTTFGALVIYNQTDIAYTLSTYSKTEIDALLIALTDASVKASDVIIGTTKLTAPPLDSANPIAVGAGDTAYLSQRESVYLKDYASLSAAITATGPDIVELVVDENINVAANLTIPANIYIQPTGNAKFTVSTGVTLDILAGDFGDRRYFYGAGTTRVLSTSNAEVKLVWWSGYDTSADQTQAIDSAIASVVLGGTVIIPPGTWLTSGGHTLTSGVNIRGAGKHQNGSKSTVIKLTAVSESIFTINGLTTSVSVKNLMLDGDYKADSIGIMLTGEYPNSIINVAIEADFYKFKGVGALANYSINNAGGGIEVANLTCTNCNFIANDVGFYSNTINSLVGFYNTYFQLPDYGIGIELVQSGLLNIIGVNAGGSSGAPACVGTDPDPALATFLKVTGDHLPINIVGYQDEAIGYFLDSQTYSYRPINISGSLIQSLILVKGTEIINSTGNWLYRQAFRDTAASTARISSRGDVLQQRNFCQVTTTPDDLDGDLIGGTIVLTQNANPALARETKRQHLDLILNSVFTGNPTNPIFQIGSPEAAKILMRIGLTDTDGVFTKYYDFKRNDTSQKLEISNTGDTAPGVAFEGLLSADDITVDNSLTTLDAVINGDLIRGGVDQPPVKKGTVSIDAPSIAAGASADVTFTATGIVTTDFIQVFPPQAGLTAGIIIGQARPSGTANQASVRIFNHSAAAIDLAALTFGYVIWK